MSVALIDQYSKEELEKIVQNSSSLKEVIDKIGYSTHSGSNSKTVKTRLENYNIDYSHFSFKKGVERNEENVFIENSTASQQTLRRWYLKGNYTDYKCSICGQEPVWQDKPLTLILDHINGNNHDDRLENLRWVCPNCNQQLDTTNGKNIKNKLKLLVKHYYCKECGKEITKNSHSGLCVSCMNKAKRVQERPSRDELKQLIRSVPFTTIAKQYNVSDNTIRKWCDSENLPRKVSEIKKYSDKDWELI